MVYTDDGRLMAGLCIKMTAGGAIRSTQMMVRAMCAQMTADHSG